MSDTTFSTSAWFVGEGSLLVRCAESYLDAGQSVAGVASSDPAVIKWAESKAIRVVRADDSLPQHLTTSPFDYLFSIVNLTRLMPDVLRAPKKMAINFHDGPLPHYAGLYAPVWALLQGETSFGVTWHEMTDAVDAGRILKQSLFELPSGETSFGLNARCYEAGLASFVALVEDLIRDRISPIAQPSGLRTLYRRHQRPGDHGVIDWNRSAEDIERIVRAADFGPYPNPFGACRLITDHSAYLVSTAEVVDTPGSPGRVEHIDAEQVTIGTSRGCLRLTGLRRLTGEAVSPAEFATEAGLRMGFHLESNAPRPSVETMQAAVRAETRWLDHLRHLDTLHVPFGYENERPGASVERHILRGTIPAPLASHDDEALAALCAAFLTRLADRSDAVVPFVVAPAPAEGLPLLADRAPVAIKLTQTWDSTLAGVRTTLRDAAESPFFTDLVARYPDHRALRGFATWRSHVVVDPRGHATESTDTNLLVRPDAASGTLEWRAAANMFPRDALSRLHDLWVAFASQVVATDAPLVDIPLVDGAARKRLIEDWNNTEVPHEVACIHEFIERQARSTPDAIALVASGTATTYRDLDARANQLARFLQSVGIGVESRVGICMYRTTDLVVALLGVLKAGAAYVPLDPDYPAERLQLVSQDAELVAVVAEDSLASRFGSNLRVVSLAAEAAKLQATSSAALGHTSRPDHLAYIIYTSGSTGRPKGVMVEHRQVANFFAGMDACVPHETPGVWLAVTSISFDISVLELFWTLARGFTVVLYAGTAAAHRALSASTRAERIDFSLFYFSADEGQDAGGKYRLLLDGARFADSNGFSAVWTPERHFHAFGGLYPNPAVTGAAVAAITSRVGIRAGSCVLPLHHPLRVAEEWSVVDNLSGGRIGIAFASGWQPNDFVLRPENYADRKRVLFEGVETVRSLWRGEAVAFPTPRGMEQPLRTLPRPLQPELPVWITAAGNPETFEAAARAGAGVLTHLLGQSVEELAGKVEAYRRAWRAAGHEGSGHVVLMLHTLVSDSDEFVRKTVRQPLMDYLRTSIDLVKPFAESFPTFAARANGQSPSEVFASLSDEDYAALVEHSFERYYETSGLFGRPETCLPLVDRLKEIGINEIACLVDFGVHTEVVLDNLPHLATLLRMANTMAPHEESIADLIATHEVTHFQCTPSMARMLLLDDDTKAAMRRLRGFFVGGEALPVSLARDLIAAMPDTELWNMYGPTETTVWSTAARVAAPVDAVTVGRPLANTKIYILDRLMQPVPIGLPGDLYIGGLGVARGYWQQPALTSERFLRSPFSADPEARIYATGDVARYASDGTIEFLGRSDHQVKIRGHRIELGEIEAALLAQPDIREAVVVAREDRENDKRLVAYVIPVSGKTPDAKEIRASLAATLPDFLVPSHVVFLDAFPLTPNNKIDRRALPPVHDLPATPPASSEAASELEQMVMEVWREILRAEHIGTHDNFFDIGGDSLLAAQVLSQLRQRVSQPVSLTDLFRFPTVHKLAERLGGADEDASVSRSVERARSRVDMRRQQAATAGERRAALRSSRRD